MAHDSIAEAITHSTLGFMYLKAGTKSIGTTINDFVDPKNNGLNPLLKADIACIVVACKPLVV